MLKKMVILGVVGFVAVAALKGTKVASYVRSELNSAREAVEDGIPPEREIARLRSEVKLLDKDIITVVGQIAKERVAVRDLQGQVDEHAAKQSKDKELLAARIDMVEKATEKVVYGNATLTVAEAQKELEKDVKRFTANQKTLDSFKTLLANRTKTRDNLEKQLEAMKNQKDELTATLDGMEADLSTLKLQQTESKYQTDDTRLAKIKEDLRKLGNKVAVEREKLSLMPAAAEPAPAPSGKSLKELKAELNGAGKTELKMPPAD